MDVLDNLLNQAINPSNRQFTSDTIKAIVKIIDADRNTIPAVLRLIAHRFQSPQELEALNSLCLLETLTKQCNPAFLSEVGKFKFLNEIIKVLAPKFLGDQSTLAVKRKCIRLLHQWQKDYSTQEPKFKEAYNMLCKQGIISPEELKKITNGTAVQPTSPSRQQNIFDRSAQSQKLTALLRSRDRADVAEANRIIRGILEEDQKRMEKATQRSVEMESLKNNTVLLQELTRTLCRGDASAAELELMKELGENIRKSRTLLYNYSLTHDENDVETIVEIAHICDDASTALNAYEEQLSQPNRSLIELAQPHSPAATATSGPDDLLIQDLKCLGLVEDVPPLMATIPTALHNPTTPGDKSSAPSVSDHIPQHVQSGTKYNDLADIFAGLSSGPQPSSNNVFSPTDPSVLQPSSNFSQPSNKKVTGGTNPPSKISDMFTDLDTMGRHMLGLETSPAKSDAFPDTLLPTNGPAPPARSQDESTIQATSANVDLTTIELPLSAIQPHEQFKQPLVVYPSNRSGTDQPVSASVEVTLRYTGNRPAPDVLVFVAVVTNQSTSSITDLHLRFGVPKPLHIRQLPPSGHSLCAYSPLIPISAVNQVILIHNPVKKPELQLKFQLSFNQDDEAILDSGQIIVPLQAS